MQLRILGTQSPYHTRGHACPGYLITCGKQRILLDCGSGCHRLLALPRELEHLTVVLSHLHRDHYNDVYNLQYASTVFRRQERLSEPLRICLPATPEEICRDVVGEQNAYAEYTVIDETTVLHIGAAKLTFCRTDHSAETYAVKVQSEGKTLVYTADASFSCKARLAAFAAGADVLLSEASLLTAHGFPPICAHMTAAQAAELAREAGVGQLVLTHLWPEEDPGRYREEAAAIFPNVTAAREGMIIPIDRITDEQTRRIAGAERALNRAEEAIRGLADAWEAYRNAQEDLALLERYLNSAERKRDLEADEQGKLPASLPRGVLSEDGIWDLLEQNTALRQAIARECSES